MHNDIKEILISREEIAEKCAEIGRQLTDEYDGKFPLAIGVLKGAMPFMSDLLRYTETHLEMDFMDVTSYGNEKIGRASCRERVEISEVWVCINIKELELCN